MAQQRVLISVDSSIHLLEVQKMQVYQLSYYAFFCSKSYFVHAKHGAPQTLGNNTLALKNVTHCMQKTLSKQSWL